jgi:hypothetical protein
MGLFAGLGAWFSKTFGDAEKPRLNDHPEIRDDTEEKAPDTARSQQFQAAPAVIPPPPKVPSDGTESPYRSTPRQEFKLALEMRGHEGRSQELLDNLTAKAKRRALRYFRGQKEVRHRVKQKSRATHELQTSVIEFSFFRRSSKPLHIKVAGVPVDPT